MAPRNYLTLSDVRGGMNNTDEPHSLPDDQVAYAENIDWMQGPLGGKRAGCVGVGVDGSPAIRVLPVLQATVTGGNNAVSTYDLTIPTIGDDGTGTTHTQLIVIVSTQNAAEDVTNVTYQGVAMTAALQAANGTSGRIEVWQKTNASLAGGTVTVTLAAACDSSAVALFFQRTDSLLSTTSSQATSANPAHLLTTDPIETAIGFVTYNNAATLTFAGINFVTLANIGHGNARLGVGTKQVSTFPSTQVQWSLSSSQDWVAGGIRLRGSLSSIFTGVNRPITLMRHTPTNLITGDELWMVTLFGQLARRVGGSWSYVPIVNQYVGVYSLDGLDINGASLHGKFFLSAASAAAGTMVWDGTILRFAGWPFTPPTPTVADDGGVGTFSGTRYYRVRFAAQSGGVTTRRSEPSAVVTFVPNGNDTGAVITKGLYLGGSTEAFLSFHANGQTHWEVEASLDNVLFYRIATVAIGTTTYTDTTALGVGYAANPLSDPIGQNVALPAGRFVAVDEDRLLLGGNRFSQLRDSEVNWTPVASATGVGNDERVPATTANFLNLDGLDGGGLQAMVAGESGNIYCFKWERLYKLLRTGILTSAYVTQVENHTRGCEKLAACSGQDQLGNPCVYFTDPQVGLCRVGKQGIEQLGENVRDFWFLTEFSHPTGNWGPRLFYWPEKRQVFIRIRRTDTLEYQVLVYNARFGSEGDKGWAIYRSSKLALWQEGGGLMFPEGFIRMFPLAPNTADPFIVKFDFTSVNDAGIRYRGYWVSKAYMLGGVFAKFGIMAANLYANARAATTIGLGLIKNLGTGRRDVSVSIAPTGTETHVFKPLDNAYISECFTVQFELGDPPSFTGSQLDQTWSLDELSMKVRAEDEGTS